MRYDPDENTLKRAGEILNLYTLHQVNPQQYADNITTKDVELAKQIVPDFIPTPDKESYPPNWTQLSQSLPAMLRTFRQNAQDMIDNSESLTLNLHRPAASETVDKPVEAVPEAPVHRTEDSKKPTAAKEKPAPKVDNLEQQVKYLKSKLQASERNVSTLNKTIEEKNNMIQYHEKRYLAAENELRDLEDELQSEKEKTLRLQDELNKEKAQLEKAMQKHDAAAQREGKRDAGRDWSQVPTDEDMDKLGRLLERMRTKKN
ncbi:hypothetical protein IL306_000987 [Fusarium sp. DS 682]|nr:hypothetical protein IL306_000987 [Fusarium sp. DS 682]